MLRHRVWLTLVAVMLATSVPVWAQEEDVDSLNRQVVQLYQSGRYAEASAIAERIVIRTEQTKGRNHPDLSVPLNNLAALYDAQGRYGQAETLYKRSLALRETALGQVHQDVAQSLNNLAVLYQHQGRYLDSEPLQKRAASIFEKTLGAQHPEVGKALNNLALLLKEQGRYPEAEPIYRRALAVRISGLPPDHPDVGETLNNLGALFDVTGRYADAEQHYLQALAIYENGLGPDHPAVGRVLGNLAGLYNILGRHDDVEALYKRALNILEGSLGSDHPVLGTTLNSLAAFYAGRSRDIEAEQLFKRALAINEKALGQDHPEVASNLHNLAEFYTHQGRYGDASGLQARAVDIFERAFGPDHPTVGQALSGQGVINLKLGRDYYAESLLLRALAINEKTLGPDSPMTGLVLNNLGDVYFTRKDWRNSVEFLQRGAMLTAKSVLRQTPVFSSLMKAAFRLAELEKERAKELTEQSFRMVQQARDSEAATSITQMAARMAKGDTALGKMVREHQDYTTQWQMLQKLLTQEMSKAAALRTPIVESEQRRHLNDIFARVASIDSLLLKTFPEFAALTDPQPVSVTETQSQLGAEEAFISIFDTTQWNGTPEETFIWAITKAESRWLRIDLGTSSLQREVSALRCGLDFEGAWGAKDSHCGQLLNTTYTSNDYDAGKPLPFDHQRAYALYKALFGGIEDMIQGKQLLIVPSGPLTQLPFQVLVTSEPISGPAAWLIRKHAITVLPAVSSLKALRRSAKTSNATKPFAGFGNPLLDGPDQRYKKLKQDALNNKDCSTLSKSVVGEARGGGVKSVLLRGGVAEVAELRLATPLPETAEELCDVAKAIGAEVSDVFLGERATESQIKALSDNGQLKDYRIVHFATHGALAGEVSGSMEPGLLLTPPSLGTQADDGYLSASEIATLKLDANWSILSACNTAAGGADGAEAMSGLARAFFYAGTRALLVSHWYVNSAATVALITGAFKELKSDSHIGRAEAMRRSMLKLADSSDPQFSQPSAWAPFVVVGEGAGVP